MSNTLMSFSLSRIIWKGTNNCYGALRQISCTKHMAQGFSGDLTTPSLASDTDILFQNLKTAQSLTNVLKIVNEHHKIMNSNHTLRALTSIFSLQKEGKTNLPTNKLLKHPDFEKLCKNLKMHSGIIDVKDAVQALKVISYVGVPSTSTISQIILQLVRQNINSLNIHQIVFMDFLLRNFDSTPLVEALKIALPLVFEIHLPKKMNRENPVHMAECLQYAIMNGVSQDTIDLIVQSLEHFSGEIDGKTAKSIICSVCSQKRDFRYEALINKSAANLVINLENLSIKDMEVALNKLAHKYTKTFEFYYQEVLFDTCSNYIVDHLVDLRRALGVLRNSARVHHFHKPLLDYVSTIIHDNPSTERYASDIYSIAISLVLTDYKPVHWASLKEWIRGAKDLAAENSKEIIWIRFAAALCLLDIYKIDVLSRALNPSYVSHLLDKGFASDFENYCTIWQSITTYKPDLIDLLPTNIDPKDLVERCKHPNEYPLEAALQKGLGGEQFLLTNVHSKLGALIDHVIAFRRGGYAVPLERPVKFIEDLKLDGNYQLVLILGMYGWHYTTNTKMLRAGVIRTINILEQSLNCHVVPIIVSNWQELNDFEKIPYLMQRVKNKVEPDIPVDISESVV